MRINDMLEGTESTQHPLNQVAGVASSSRQPVNNEDEIVVKNKDEPGSKDQVELDYELEESDEDKDRRGMREREVSR